jgi:hypothetical protein
MSYSIVWLPRNQYDPLRGEESLSDMEYLPYYKDNSVMPVLDGRSFEVGAPTLLLGIMLVLEDNPLQSMIAPLKDFHYRKALEVLAGDYAPADELAASAASSLIEEQGIATAALALKRALALFPESVFLRADLIASLWFQAEEDPATADKFCSEIVSVFKAVDPSRTVMCANEGPMLYFGLASLVFLGRKEEYVEAKWKHARRTREEQWLSVRMGILESAKAGDFRALIPANLTWGHPSPEEGEKWSAVLASPPQTPDELMAVRDIGKPPVGPVTSVLLSSWGKLPQPLDGEWTRGYMMKYDYPFLFALFGRYGGGERRDAILRHLFYHFPEDWKTCLAKLLAQAKCARELKKELAGAGMPAMGKQICGANNDFSVGLARYAETLDRRMHGLPPIDYRAAEEEEARRQREFQERWEARRANEPEYPKLIMRGEGSSRPGCAWMLDYYLHKSDDGRFSIVEIDHNFDPDRYQGGEECGEGDDEYECDDGDDGYGEPTSEVIAEWGADEYENINEAIVSILQEHWKQTGRPIDGFHEEGEFDLDPLC